MRRLSGLLVAILLLGTACSEPAAGSIEDLTSRLDRLELPASATELGEKYDEDCPTTCPSLVRWYDISGPTESIPADLVSRLEAAGLSVNQNPVNPGILSATGEGHIFFVVTDPEMIAGNVNAPPGADAEISVQAIPET